MSRYFSLGYRYFAEETLARDRRLLSVIPWDKRDNYELEVTYVAKVTAVNRLDGHRVTLAEASEVQAVPEQTLNDYVVTGKLQPFKVQLHKLEVTMQLAARQAGKDAFTNSVSVLTNTCFTEGVPIPEPNPASNKAKPVARPCTIASTFGYSSTWLSYAMISALEPNEYLKTPWYVYNICAVASSCSMRDSVAIINMMQLRELGDASDAISLSSAEDIVKRNGERIDAVLDEISQATLEAYGFDSNGQFKEGSDPRPIIGDAEVQQSAPKPLPVNDEEQPASDEEQPAHLQYKDPQQTAAFLRDIDVQGDTVATEVSLDGVLIKMQAIERSNSDSPQTKDPEEPKEPDDCSDHQSDQDSNRYFLQHYTAVIVATELQDRYYLVAPNVDILMVRVLAILVANNLLQNRRLIFYIDGARNLQIAINKYFGFVSNKRIYTDFWHLIHYIGELLKKAVGGCKTSKDNYINWLKTLIWQGMAEQVLTHLRERICWIWQLRFSESCSLKPEHKQLQDAMLATLNLPPIKDEAALDRAVDYLEGKLPLIPNYLARKKANLKISSNGAESANEMMVSDRQKNRRACWSFKGSIAHAYHAMLRRNKGLVDWFVYGTISLIMPSLRVRNLS